MPDIIIDPNVNVITLGHAGFEAHADRLIVLQDDYRSGYECEECGGGGEVTCENCAGSGISAIVKNGRCAGCEGRKVQLCPECNGKGGVLVVPENAERRPTTGTVVSLGDDVKKFERGDKVLYPSFAGHAFDLTAKDRENRDVTATLVILRDGEILAKMHGTLEQRKVRKSAALHTAA